MWVVGMRLCVVWVLIPEHVSATEQHNIVPNPLCLAPGRPVMHRRCKIGGCRCGARPPLMPRRGSRLCARPTSERLCLTGCSSACRCYHHLMPEPACCLLAAPKWWRLANPSAVAGPAALRRMPSRSRRRALNCPIGLLHPLQHVCLLWPGHHLTSLPGANAQPSSSSPAPVFSAPCQACTVARCWCCESESICSSAQCPNTAASAAKSPVQLIKAVMLVLGSVNAARVLHVRRGLVSGPGTLLCSISLVCMLC